jgi:hypothetical protein
VGRLVPKFAIKTTVVYEYEIEAKDYVEAILIGDQFEKYDWVMELEDIQAKEIEDN